MTPPELTKIVITDLATRVPALRQAASVLPNRDALVREVNRLGAWVEYLDAGGKLPADAPVDTTTKGLVEHVASIAIIVEGTAYKIKPQSKDAPLFEPLTNLWLVSMRFLKGLGALMWEWQAK